MMYKNGEKSDFLFFSLILIFALRCTEFLKQVFLLNHINNMAAMLLLFSLILLLSKK